MPSDCDDDKVVTGSQEYTTQEVGQMVFDMQLRQAKYEKKMMAHKHEQEAVVRQQTIVNRNINDALANLAASLRTKTALQQDYVGRLATLRQTSTVEAYQTEFEATLQDAFALAQQLAVCQAAASPVFSPKPAWQNRGSRTVQPPDPNAKQDSQPDQKQVREGQPPRDYPAVRISAAERAERTRLNLCWWCPEKYSRSHVCAKKFYALMGVDDDDAELSMDNETTPEDDGENMAIIGDVSRILVLCPKIKPRSIRLRGRVNGTAVSILIDGGSTHNFIQPAVAEKLSLPVNAISPFRVFVGDDASLKCAFACLDTPINLQGHQFGIDLFVLQVKGPDIILGVQWLQDLGDITKNYRNLTMRFEWNDQPVFLRGEDAPPRPISYNNLFSLISTDSEADIFELLLVQSSALQSSSGIAEVDPSVSQVLSEDMFAETANEGNQQESEDEQREYRRSKRIRKPPVRYGDFV
ncbi:hypothetical protein SASPL_117245 [Salvia splendens]|uniref:Uncharacterized protein n=1 Tax=Salvia splendens TaxID=180675 RepID=A0A8X8XZB9_SALSN|nr:hypothetical protein SASPL_117245 [Salvia splendens]